MRKRQEEYIELLLDIGCLKTAGCIEGLLGGPYLLCLHPGKVDKLLTELHEGVCGSHVGGHLLAHRAMTQGF